MTDGKQTRISNLEMGITTRRFVSFNAWKGHLGKLAVKLLTRNLKLRYRYLRAVAGVKLQRLAWLGLALLVVARKWGCSRKSGTERPERHAEFPRALRRPGDHCRVFPFLPLILPEARIPIPPSGADPRSDRRFKPLVSRPGFPLGRSIQRWSSCPRWCSRSILRAIPPSWPRLSRSLCG